MADNVDPRLEALPGDHTAASFGERIEAIQNEPPSPKRLAARRAAAAARALIERLVATTAPADAIEAAAAIAEDAVAKLGDYPRGRSFEGFAESSTAGDPSAFFDYSPIIGAANPLAPPVNLRVEDGVVVGDVNWGSAYEGPPGCVHGGYIAAAFDDVLGLAQSLAGMPGMTGTLTIRYRRPTPLQTDLRFEARLERAEGRKIIVTGQLLTLDGELLAESDGVFIRVDFARLGVLADERERLAKQQRGESGS